MTTCPECYGVGEAVISCGFCGAYVCEECYMHHLAACGPDDGKQKPVNVSSLPSSQVTINVQLFDEITISLT